MSLILTTAIEKGGTGKTTTVVNLAALMAAEGKRVLVVDMDQQANTTYMLTQHKKAENFYKGHGLVNMFMNFDLGGMDLTPYIHPTNVEGVHIIPSTAQTPRAVHQLDLLADEYKMKNYTFLIHCLANINDDYDYIVIDTPPARDNLTMSALFCADEVLIPVRCDNFSLEGFETTLAMILDLETREDVKIDILGVVLTQVERTGCRQSGAADVRGKPGICFCSLQNRHPQGQRRAGKHHRRRTGGALLQEIQSFRGLYAALERDQTASGKKGG